MPDRALQIEILAQLLEGVGRIERRFAGIRSADDFLATEAGIDRLDAIGMMLIAIGESLKNFEHSGGKTLLDRHPEVDWKGAKGVRDFLSHHYFDLDAEIVFVICSRYIGGMKTALLSMQKELQG
ncbi:MAG: DUF86 domain-containing protein [Campylobacterales bacterium]